MKIVTIGAMSRRHLLPQSTLISALSGIKPVGFADKKAFYADTPSLQAAIEPLLVDLEEMPDSIQIRRASLWNAAEMKRQLGLLGIETRNVSHRGTAKITYPFSTVVELLRCNHGPCAPLCKVCDWDELARLPEFDVLSPVVRLRTKKWSWYRFDDVMQLRARLTASRAARAPLDRTPESLRAAYAIDACEVEAAMRRAFGTSCAMDTFLTQGSYMALEKAIQLQGFSIPKKGEQQCR